MNPFNSDWTIEIARELEEKQGDFPTNLASDALARFFTLLGLKTNEKGNSTPLFRTGQQKVRLLILTPYSTKTLEGYFKAILLEAYGKETLGFSKQKFLFIDSLRENQSDRFFHVMGSIFKHAGIDRKVDVDKLLTIFSPAFKCNEDRTDQKNEAEGKLRLRNSIEETCFATGVEEMREFLFRDSGASKLHELFHEVKENKKNALRLIFGAYLAGDVSLEVLKSIVGEFFPGSKTTIPEITKEIENKIEPSLTNPLWKYLENRKILVIDDGWELEGWNIVLPAILLSPGSAKEPLPPNIIWHKGIIEALDAFGTGEKLADFDLILLDLYSSVDEHKRLIHITNMKDSLWQFIEALRDIRKSHIARSIPQPMPQVIVFSRDDKGLTVHTMFKELNAADYFFKKTEFEEHKCGYYSSFRNAVISALKETVYQVGGMTDIPSRLHFNKWLRQFDPCDRPLILHLMKHFKYFSAINIMNLLDSYLKNNTTWKDDAVSILKSSPRKPDRFYISYLGHPYKSGPTTLALLSKTGWFRKLRKDAEKHELKKFPKFLSYEDLLHCLVEDILTKDDKDDHMCLLLIDDCVGSGGQIKDYLNKFIGRDLKTFCEKLFVKPRSNGGTWEKVKRAFNKDHNGNVKNLEIIALFALGIQNKEHFEEMIQKYERNNDDTHSINGSFNVDVKSEKLSIPVKIHVAHYTRSIQEIFNDNEEFLKESEETLRKYSVIMELRDEDHPCDFIPWGWKENGGLISTYANAQGNTIPVIWQDYISKEDLIHRENGLSIKKWKPLFPRYFNPLTPGKKRDKIEPKDEKILKCQNTKKCPVNPVKWDKQFFEEHWKKDVDAAPPCKIEPDK